MLTIEIPGEVVAKKNSQRVVRFGKGEKARYAIRPSKAYDAYSGFAVPFLKATTKRWKGGYPVIAEVFFYRQTRRKFDLDNMHSSVLDVLVNAGIIDDDAMTHVIPKIDRHGWEVDKENPRVVVKIYEYQPTEETQP